MSSSRASAASYSRSRSAAPRAADFHVGDHDRPPEQVVQDDERVGDHHHGVRQVERVGRGARQTLDGAHQVVAQGSPPRRR